VSQPDYSVRLLPAAEEDLTEIVLYIAADRPSAAEKVANTIEKKLQVLARTPHLGHIPTDEELIRQGYRYFSVGKYLVFYTIEEQTIYVHRILHGARDYLKLF